MKNNKILMVCYTLLVLLLVHCNQQKEELTKDTIKIAVMNPELWDVKSFIHLIEHNVIDIPNLDLLVVIFSKAENEYKEISEFLDKNSYPYIHLLKVDCNLEQENLYQKNSCTAYFKKIVNETDGVMFLGGPDIPPGAYREKTGLITAIKDPYRHFFELSFYFHLLGGFQDEKFTPFLEKKPDYCVVGFCLGMQSMIVGTGGSLIQDIPSELYRIETVEDVLKMDQNQKHRNYWRNLYPDTTLIGGNFHQIKVIDTNFVLNKLLTEENKNPIVYSSHHQAAGKMGKDLVIGATSMDGKIVEGVYHNKYKNVFSIQFHPEFDFLYLLENKKFSPDDSSFVSRREILEKGNSLKFHYNFWKEYAKIFER